MSQFKVGGKVVAIEDITFRTLHNTKPYGDGPLIKKGEVFTVLEVNVCACGAVKIDVGFKSATGRTFCPKCKYIYPNVGAWYVISTCFVPIEEQEFKEVTYTKILDEIPACAQ